jgi:hypothetical protein
MEKEVKFKFDLPDDYEECKYLNNFLENGIIVETLYDQVFRPVIKYSDDDLEIKYYEEIWEKISQHIESIKE